MNTSKRFPPPANDPHDSSDSTNHAAPTPAPNSPPPGKPGLDISGSQVLGGALAAMTAAALGSRLGVAGTITGAAVASVIAAIAGSLYTASLRHTREKVKTVWTGRVVPGSSTAAATSGTSQGAEVPLSVDVVPDAPVWDPPAQPTKAQRPSRRSIGWKPVLTGAVAAFALAAVSLTGFELVTGQALSGGQGTTIQQVSKERQPGSSTKKTTPSKSASPSKSTSATPSESASATPSESPSATASESAPEAAPSDPATTEPSAPSTQQPTREQSEAPSESATTQEEPSASSTATDEPSVDQTPAG